MTTAPNMGALEDGISPAAALFGRTRRALLALLYREARLSLFAGA